MSALGEIVARVAELERRLAGMLVDGTVAQVEANRVRLKIGEQPDGSDLLSPWIGYAQQAGGLKAHLPPTIGQPMMMFCPSGDKRRGLAMPSEWSDDNASPSEAGDENVITYGEVRVELRADEVIVSVGGNSWRLSGDGFETAGPTKLDGGTRKIAYVGSHDSRGDTITEGANQVYV